MNAAATAQCLRFELRFQSLFHEGRALAFPCDAEGRVDPARLAEAARRNYQRALAAIGRDYSMPELRCNNLH